MIQVGTGGFGAAWCREFLSPSVRDRRVKVVAAVDLEPAALQNAQRYLRLPPERCYTDPERAFAENPPISAPWSSRQRRTRRSSISHSDMSWTSCPRSRSPTRSRHRSGLRRKSDRQEERWASR